MEDIETRRAYEKDVEEAWKLYIANTSRIEEITNELKMPEKRQRLQSLLLEYKRLEQKMKTCKAFNFKAKKELTLQIEEKKQELTNLHTEIIQTEMFFQKEKSEKEQELAAVSLLINGADGSCEEYLSTRSEAFRLRTV